MASSDLYYFHKHNIGSYILSSICYKPALGGFCGADCTDDQFNITAKTRELDTILVAFNANKENKVHTR